jgi:hypothetical protein
MTTFAVLTVPFCVAITSLAGPAICQEKPQPATPKPLDVVVVAIDCKAEGAAMARVPDANPDEALAKARAWDDRELQWRVQGGAGLDPRGVKAKLEALARSAEALRDDPDAPGNKILVPLRIEPGHGSRWNDVVRTVDLALQTGWNEVQLQGVDTIYTLPKAIDAPVAGHGALIVPRAIFSEPDDRPEPLRPVFDVHQDGRILHGDDVLFQWVPAKAEDLAPLNARLGELRKDLVGKGHLKERSVAGKVQKVLDVPFLVRADKWAEWSDVRRVIARALDPAHGFWKLELGVTELDHETKLRADPEWYR